ncbi:hypothetical protein F4604DRAFT_985792 [Suillus subluteus]|nr:hypothetical protein F4604DRAFT_985792 [Suillus subluteus]
MRINTNLIVILLIFFFEGKSSLTRPSIGSASSSLNHSIVSYWRRTTEPQVPLIMGVKRYKSGILYSYFDTVTFADFSGTHSWCPYQASPLRPTSTPDYNGAFARTRLKVTVKGQKLLMGSPSSKYHGACAVHIPLGNRRCHETLN